MIFATPPTPNQRIDEQVAAFAELLAAPGLVVVCRYRPTGDVIAVNAYDHVLPAMLAAWTCEDEMVAVETHPTGPLTAEEGHS
jgi:hypothetical protein